MTEMFLYITIIISMQGFLLLLKYQTPGYIGYHIKSAYFWCRTFFSRNGYRDPFGTQPHFDYETLCSHTVLPIFTLSKPQERSIPVSTGSRVVQESVVRQISGRIQMVLSLASCSQHLILKGLQKPHFLNHPSFLRNKEMETLRGEVTHVKVVCSGGLLKIWEDFSCCFQCRFLHHHPRLQACHSQVYFRWP